MATVLGGLARQLVRADVMTEPAMLAALRAAIARGVSLPRYLRSTGVLDANTLARHTATAFRLPLLDLDAVRAEDWPLHLADATLLRRHQLLPLASQDGRLHVAMADPGDRQALADLGFHSGLTPCPVVVEDDKLAAALERHLPTPSSTSEVLPAPSRRSGYTPQPALVTAQESSAEDDAPVVGYVQWLLREACRRGASDIHVEPGPRQWRVRLRIDGVLQDPIRPPADLAPRLPARLKVLAQLDITERRLPQDGRFRVDDVDGRALECRVSVVPTVWGEKAVLRLQTPASRGLALEALGLEPDQLNPVRAALVRCQGMVLVTGPTGSGKTMTLYAALGQLNTTALNIASVEDPVEMHLPGINQVQIHPRIGLTFASSLRAFLRQDPDILMVGEIRDAETADIAVKAAQTGHLVLSTLHTNSAAETVTRLRAMGIPGYHLAGSLQLIIAQRLVRRLCDHCKRSDTSAVDWEGLGGSAPPPPVQRFSATGCERCHQGYRGRIGIYEVVPVSPALARIIMANGDAHALAYQAAQEGVCDLRQAALRKVLQGVTSLDEALRVT